PDPIMAIRIASAFQQAREKSLRFSRRVGPAERHGDIRLEKTQPVAAIITPAGVAHRVERLAADHPGERIGELDLAARAGLVPVEMVEYLGLQHVAADQRPVRRRFRGVGLLDQSGDLGEAVLLSPDGSNAVALGLLARYLDDSDHAAAGLLAGGDQLRGAGRRADHKLIGQQYGERLAADPRLGAPHGMAEAERLLLAGEDGVARL